MNILSLVIMGLLAGAVAKFYTPGKNPGGIIGLVVVGVVGALVGQLIGSLIGFSRIAEFDARTFMITAVSTIVVLAVYGKLFKVRAAADQ